MTNITSLAGSFGWAALAALLLLATFEPVPVGHSEPSPNGTLTLLA